MNAVPQRPARIIAPFIGSLSLLAAVLATPCRASSYGNAVGQPAPSTVKVNLSEWKVQLTPARVPPGPVVFEVTNTGTIPHAFEVEGGGLERSTPQMQPGATVTLRLDLRAGSYETYCPVGKDSHKMLGMLNHLMVGDAKRASAKGDQRKEHEEHEKGEAYEAGHEMVMGHEMAMEHPEHDEHGDGAKSMRVAGGDPVIQILPGPFPFADSAAAVIRNRPPEQQADLNHKAQMGPYSNNVATISGDISLVAIDRGATGDSVSGVAQFTTQDGARWKLVMDRVQTKDIPFNPRFGGVIMGLFYHGASGVHTPLVPTIQSSLALWAYAHLYKNDHLVTDDAMVHVMLLSRTRRTSDWALDCWDCSNRPIEELQLQVTAAPGTPPFDAPGGFLFVNWEKSSGQRLSL
ncbi:MAG: hypothetical protein E6K72_02265 [Candidatus Eisenbacteria bacterium]|uniref:EfeO-type cupredoxin-like domain-containing protein n=1 Tax=Eiseniibacteriota bacterium TaxID=2212470 RepID=A0A538T4Z4_UNCEI|nr:MAG: hypothetical protein E6K72_02265 [Candidatus Eisenbacteria bacterium]